MSSLEPVEYCSMARFSFVKPVLALLCIIMAVDSGKEKDECAEQLVGLATCLPYVSGQAKTPTPDCCNGLKQVLNTNKKCLCVIIQDQNDPDLGLNINLTLALGLPSSCSTYANVSKCPELLHLSPNSPEARIFYQDLNHSASISSIPASSPSPSGSSSNSEKTSPPPKSCGHYNYQRGPLNILVLFYFISFLNYLFM